MVLAVCIRLADSIAKLPVHSTGLPALHDNLSELCLVPGRTIMHEGCMSG